MNITKTAYARFVAAIAAIAANGNHAKRAAAATGRERIVGRHHPGHVGHGHTKRKSHSQIKRSIRRHARRAAKAARG